MVVTRQDGRFQLPRRRRRKGKPPLPGLTIFKNTVDPVALTVMALNILAPALSRANTTGKRVVVTVPDARTGEIFRAALALSQEVRATDRLIDIVVADSLDDTLIVRHGRRTH